MKVTHESPKALLNKSLEYNDFEYCLLPLALKDKEYLDFYKNSLKNGRRVILDNGLWEGHVPNQEEYLNFIIEHGFIEIIPIDRWQDTKFTIESAKNTRKQLDDLGHPEIKLASVVHGNNVGEYAECYIELSKISDTICFPMELEHNNFSRSEVIYKLRPYINYKIKHHILGINNPLELLQLKKISWIDSIDTSSPVLHGMIGVGYSREKGLEKKSSIKMIDIYNNQVEEDTYKLILRNIKIFRQWAKK